MNSLSLEPTTLASSFFRSTPYPWGAQGTVSQLWNVIATWKPKASGLVTGRALACGHVLPEEQPDEVL